MLLYPTATFETTFSCGPAASRNARVDLGRQQRQHRVGTGDPLVQLVDLDGLVVLPAPHVAVRAEHIEASIGDSSSDDDPRLGHQAASIHSRSLPMPSWMSSTEIPE